jgi:quercetin dioxygenase-like cupin family protein
MKPVLVLLCLVGSAFPQGKSHFTTAPTKAPQPIVETREPHTTQLFSNNEARVVRIDLDPNASTAMARHAHNFILVSLGDNDFELAGQANSVPMSLKNEETQVITGNWPHKVVNKASHPLHLIEIEIAKGIVPEQAICGLNGASCISSKFAYNDNEKYVTSLLFETPTIKVGKVEIDPSSGMPEHGHTSSHLMVALTDEQLTNSVVGQGSSAIEGHPGDAQWLAGDIVHKLTNQGTGRARFLTVEWK